MGFLWGESTVPGASLCQHYKLIIIASDIQCVKYADPSRDGGVLVDVSGFTKALSLFTADPAVARRINGLIKHAILLVMQSLSMPRRREREKERVFIRPAPPLFPRVHAPPVDHAAGLVPLPFYMLDYIRFSHVTEGTRP